MSELPWEKKEREEWEMHEIAAEYRALPLRAILSIDRDGTAALLDCGHRKPLLVRLREGDSVRCRECYDAQMHRAEKMIEGLEE
jgi:hypothetical protein